MEHLQTSISGLKSGEAGHIRIGVTEPSASYRFPRILGDFIAKFPNIHISMDILNTPIMSERILKGEEFVVLMPENHPLTQKKLIEPEDFRGYRLLITSAICPYRRKLEVVLQERGNVQLDTMEIGSMTALKYYVENGLGIALVPKVMVEPVPTGTTVGNISGTLVHMTMGILCKESAYPFQLASQRLYSYLKQELGSLSL